MSRALKILAIHGVGHSEASSEDWQGQWIQAITRGLKSAAAHQSVPEAAADIQFFSYDHFFENPAYPVTGRAYLQALRELGAGLFFREMTLSAPDTRGLFDRFTQGIRWSVGMVAQWVAYKKLRQELNAALFKQIRATQPDVIVAHSLGTLISYDALTQRPPRRQMPEIFLTCGSQIGHPAVLGSVFGGRVQMPPVQNWFHLFNSMDQIFTAEIRVSDRRFCQVETRFDTPLDWSNHDAVEYLQHTNTGRAWDAMVTRGASEATHRTLQGLFKQERVNGAMYRALIIGIDQYANPQANLEGCANDAYLMSATLQELGFPCEQIRLLLNERATSVTIRDRLEWLLDDVQPGDVRFLHYSGHGAQIPSYGPNSEIDQLDECLVPHDFDWTPGRAILDDWFYERYSQLPYDSRFIAVFDCCHSGGLTRSGGIRVRGLNPPDDIRHRAIEYDSNFGWRPRDLKRIEIAVSARRALKSQLTGSEGTTHMLGGAIPLRRTQSTIEYQQAKRTYRHLGPYLPVLLHACAEVELAEEVRVGSTTHGAFTYHLTNALRHLKKSRRGFTYKSLVKEAAKSMAAVGIVQQPQLVGPSVILNKSVSPLERATKTRPAANRKSKPTKKRAEG